MLVILCACVYTPHMIDNTQTHIHLLACDKCWPTVVVSIFCCCLFSLLTYVHITHWTHTPWVICRSRGKNAMKTIWSLIRRFCGMQVIPTSFYDQHAMFLFFGLFALILSFGVRSIRTLRMKGVKPDLINWNNFTLERTNQTVIVRL